MAPNKKRNTCLIVGLALVGLCICALVVGGGGGYYLFYTGKLSLNDIAGFLGVGPAEIQVANLTDTTLVAELTYIDEETGEVRNSDTLDMGEYDISTITGISAREYKLVFTTGSGIPEGGTCQLSVKGGDSWVFVAVPEGIGVIRNSEAVDSNEDVNIQTSFLCRGED